ncbi:TIGR04282 family arsenosugar biosynthesis glycosyltransferase [Tenacibaculum xiamenense]|uniref:TIGR04282 family arsenosugar biosynthesis glycosyltransferase n=1 Tax=Tenacibaculum xiamenense TaxID=1261553 RepID=UPI003894A62E
MLKRADQTAILIFANSSKEEMHHKSFLKDERLIDYLNSKTVKLAEKACSNVIVYDESLQVGSNFSEKFSNAIHDIFKRGFKNVITIGNDSPELKVSHIQEAIHKLQEGQNVIGPSKDGGVYLIGICKDQFDLNEFLSLSWQTKFLSNDLEDLLKSKGSKIKKLEYLQDIDSYHDLLYFSNHFSLSEILRGLIITLIHNFKKQVRRTYLPITGFHYSAYFFNKGSPAIS